MNQIEAQELAQIIRAEIERDHLPLTVGAIFPAASLLFTSANYPLGSYLIEIITPHKGGEAIEAIKNREEWDRKKGNTQ